MVWELRPGLVHTAELDQSLAQGSTVFGVAPEAPQWPPLMYLFQMFWNKSMAIVSQSTAWKTLYFKPKGVAKEHGEYLQVPSLPEELWRNMKSRKNPSWFSLVGSTYQELYLAHSWDPGECLWQMDIRGTSYETASSPF